MSAHRGYVNAKGAGHESASPDIGGAFGMKGSPYPEQALVLWAAQEPARQTAKERSFCDVERLD